jgi:hypothetical protein
MQALRWVLGTNLALARRGEKMAAAAAAVQLDGSVLIWHMTDWLLVFNAGLLFIGVRFKSENGSYEARLANRGRAEHALAPLSLFPPTTTTTHLPPPPQVSCTKGAVRGAPMLVGFVRGAASLDPPPLDIPLARTGVWKVRNSPLVHIPRSRGLYNTTIATPLLLLPSC